MKVTLNQKSLAELNRMLRRLPKVGEEARKAPELEGLAGALVLGTHNDARGVFESEEEAMLAEKSLRDLGYVT